MICILFKCFLILFYPYIMTVSTYLSCGVLPFAFFTTHLKYLLQVTPILLVIPMYEPPDRINEAAVKIQCRLIFISHFTNLYLLSILPWRHIVKITLEVASFQDITQFLCTPTALGKFVWSSLCVLHCVLSCFPSLFIFQ